MCIRDRIRDVPYIHIDVEDGNFLPNITFGMKTVKEMAAYSKAELLSLIHISAATGKDIIVRNPHSTRPYQLVLEPLAVYLTIAMRQYEDGRYQGCLLYTSRCV